MNNFNRYNRQILLPQMDLEKQQLLFEARVLVIGVGGLGCPVLKTLAGAGVGNLGLVDHDIVSLSNLHRQILFDESDIGKLKAEVALNKLYQYNSEINYKAYTEKISLDNIFNIVNEYDLVVDCTDNFSSRYLINDVCFLLNKKLVYAAIFQNEGQLAVFNCNSSNPTNLRDIFPVQPKESEYLNCNEAGVMGVLTSVMGNFQANEVIKLIINSNDILIDKLLIFNSIDYTTHFVKFKINENLKKITKEEIYKNEYDSEICTIQELGIKNKKEFKNWLNLYNTLVIDVRNFNEQPRLKDSLFNLLEIPLSQLDIKLNEIELENYDSLVFVCQTGKRSKQAIEIAKNTSINLKLIDVENGINSII